MILIGLIIGGVAVGKDLLVNFEIRAQLSQIEKLDSALQTFRIKYDCMPGDCAQAVSAGLGTAGGDGDNGDGDGKIIHIGGPLNFNDEEIQNFWYHLGQASLIESYPKGTIPGINSPALAMPGNGISGNKSGGVWIAPLYYPNPTTTVVNSWALVTATSGSAATYSAQTSYNIDNKIDDGLPMTGNVLASHRFYTNTWSVGFGTDTGGGSEACLNDSDMANIRYNLLSSGGATLTALCLIRIKNSLSY